jgi:F-type H+-transporting ATPase subunit gamma
VSDTVNSLRQKINSAEELQSVVRTMKAMAASSIGQYEKSVFGLTDYYRAVELGLGVCFRQTLSSVSLSTDKKKFNSGSIGAVVFGSDQGLVGQFNDVVADYAIKKLVNLSGTHRIWAVGERVHARLADAGLPLIGLFKVPNSIKAITPLVGQILMSCEKYREQNELDEFYLFYNHPTSVAVYEPFCVRLLPLDEIFHNKIIKLPWPSGNLPEVVSDCTATLGALIREYLFISIFRACSESLASENASRLDAMGRADKNIEDLLENLNRTFHQLRQSGIDEELFDVLSGYESLGVSKAQKILIK